jgi:hypothetical protein
MAAPGPLALVSQSGALTASILDWAQRQRRGLLGGGLAGAEHRGGPAAGAGLPGQRCQHPSILVYMEGIRNARRFMSALRAAAYAKPVVVMKAGRKPAGSHRRAHALGGHRRQRRCLRGRPAPRRRGAGAAVHPAVLGRQVPGLALPAGGQAPGHRHQRRRAGCAGGRLGQRDRAGGGHPDRDPCRRHGKLGPRCRPVACSRGRPGRRRHCHALQRGPAGLQQGQQCRRRAGHLFAQARERPGGRGQGRGRRVPPTGKPVLACWMGDAG